MAMASSAYAPAGGVGTHSAPGRIRPPRGLGFSTTTTKSRPLVLTRRGGGGGNISVARLRCAASSSSAAARPMSQPRFIQHKKEAFWFYRFLSIVYDHVINPGHWTEDMRDDALEPADLYSR